MFVCINKMDDKTVNWSQERYEEIRKVMSSWLKKVGFDPAKVPFIPISG
jgi:elongation factor 1-alpha